MKLEEGKKIIIKKGDMDTHELSYLFKNIHPDDKAKIGYVVVERLRGAIIYTSYFKQDK